MECEGPQHFSFMSLYMWRMLVKASFCKFRRRKAGIFTWNLHPLISYFKLVAIDRSSINRRWLSTDQASNRFLSSWTCLCYNWVATYLISLFYNILIVCLLYAFYQIKKKSNFYFHRSKGSYTLQAMSRSHVPTFWLLLTMVEFPFTIDGCGLSGWCPVYCRFAYQNAEGVTTMFWGGRKSGRKLTQPPKPTATRLIYGFRSLHFRNVHK